MKFKFTSKFHIPVSQPPKPTKSKIQKFFTDPLLIFLQWVRHYLTIATTAIHDGLFDLWHNHYPEVANMQRHVVMPQSTFSFIITFMLAFAEIKSQGQPGFPFKSHLLLVRFSIGIVLILEAQGAENLKTDTPSTNKAITTARMLDLSPSLCRIFD